jgi:hypothetical protein
MARGTPETKFCSFKIFFEREKQVLEILFIIEVHVLNLKKYICIFFIFILIKNWTYYYKTKKPKICI